MSAAKKERGVDFFAIVIAGLVFVAFGAFVLVRHLNAAKNSATLVTASPTAIIYGQSVTLSATVAPSNGKGNVTFEEDHVPIANCTRMPLSKARTTSSTTTTTPGTKAPKPGTVYTAHCVTSSIGAGKRRIEAYYSGDHAFNKSAGAVQIRVKKLGTTITVTSSLPTSNAFQTVTFTATVASSIDHGGTVTFTSHNTNISGCTDRPLTVSGVDHIATCSTSALPPGKYAIRATYHGDINHAPSSGTIHQIVKKLYARATITAFPNPGRVGSNVTIVATVVPNHAGGTFAFFTSGHAIAGCTAVPLTSVNGTYEATCTTSSMKRGTHVVKAIYRDSSYLTAAATLHEKVDK